MSSIFSCRDAARLASGTRDRRLAIGERITLHVHLMMCSACRDWRRQIDQLDQLVLVHLKSGAGTSDETLSAEAKAAMAERLRQQLPPVADHQG